ncbi:hypothetical protein BR93DRAFT_922159 [Coniochaeta sp. PMI_546]|nr:hypothetical protein BR93DRAFT_922159 [Coniochaeta sp. PMI_546]
METHDRVDSLYYFSLTVVAPGAEVPRRCPSRHYPDIVGSTEVPSSMHGFCTGSLAIITEDGQQPEHTPNLGSRGRVSSTEAYQRLIHPIEM